MGKLKSERKAVSIDPFSFSSETAALEERAAAPVESRILKGKGVGKPDTRAGKPKTAKPPKVRDHYIVLSPSSPLDSASRFLQEHHTQDGLRLLHYHADSFFTYKGTHYQEIANQAIKTQVYEFLEQAKRLTDKGYVPFEPDQRKVSNVMDALKSASFRGSEIDLPVWLGDDSRPPAAEILACANGLLHLPSLKLLKHTPAFFALESLPFDFDPEAPKPTQWLEFLDQLWRFDRVSIRLLRQWFGYNLVRDTQQQKILLIIGPIRSGKGTIGRILRKMLGASNTCSPTFYDLTQPFGLQPLLNKRLAVISDARLGKGADQSLALERLLSISGEDQQTVHRKNRTAWNGTLPVKFMILTNELPEIKDSSMAVVSRLVVLKLVESFYGQEDTELTDRLTMELPGILNWSIFGLKQLQKRGHFVQPKSAKGSIHQLEDLASPISQFLKEECQLGPEFSVSTGRLFKAWKSWSEAQGLQPGSMSVFGQSLSSYAPNVEKKRPRKDGRKGRYIGIKLA